MSQIDESKLNTPDSIQKTTEPVSETKTVPTTLSRAELNDAIRNDPRLATLTPQAKLFLNITLLIGVSLFFGVTSWNFLRLNNVNEVARGSEHLPFIDTPTLILFGISLASLLVWLYSHWRFVWARGDIRKMRWMQWTLLELLLILMTLASTVNLFGFNYYSRFDISDQKGHSLQDETRQVIESIRSGENPIRVVYITRRAREEDRQRKQFDFTRHSERVERLLNEFDIEADHLAHGKLETQYVDLDQQPKRAAELADELGVPTLQADWAFGLILMSGHVTKTGGMVRPDWMVITSSDMYQTVAGKRELVFTGEDALASGLQTVLLGKMDKCWYLRGYGEPSLSQLPELSAALAGANLLPQSVNLKDMIAIPNDIKMVLVAGPKFPIPNADIDKLIRYYENGGNLMVCVEPAQHGETGLNRLLKTCGLSALETQPIIYGAYKDNVLIRQLRQKMNPDISNLIRLFGRAPSENDSSGFIEFDTAIPLFPLSFSASAIAAGTAPQVIALARTLESDQSEDNKYARKVWANDRIGDPRPASADNDKDIAGPLVTACASFITTGGANTGETISAAVKQTTSRMIVVGGFSFINHPEIGRQSANILFLQQSVKWITGSPRTLGVSTRIRESFRIPPDRLTDNHYALMVAIFAIGPAALAIIAGIVVSIRRNRIGEAAAFDDGAGV